MAENVVINDTTYNGVDSLALVRADGSVATFYPDAVRYNEQTLTDAQKAQARQNIGVTGTGANGQRGTGILNTTTGIASYTTAVGGVTPAYRILLSTLKTQAKVDDVLVGDTVRYSYYLYPVIYVDADYAYMTTRVNIRGSAGAAGTDGEDGATPVKGVDYWTDADKTEMVNAVIAALPVYNGEVV